MSKKDSSKTASKRAALIADLEVIVTAAASESREFTTEEADKRAAITAKVEKIDDQVRAAEAAAKAERKAAKAAAARVDLGVGDGAPTALGNLRVGNEPQVYGPGSGNNFLMDQMKVAADQFGGRTGTAAQARLAEHAKQIAVEGDAAKRRIMSGSPRVTRTGFNSDRYFVSQIREGFAATGLSTFEAQNRDLSTAAGAGGEFVPPMYLTEEWIAFARAGRVFANACRRQDLPPGTMSISIPKVDSGVTVSPQGTQNTNVSNTDLGTEYVTFPVITVAGAQNISLQLIERSPVDFQGVAFSDLAAAQAQAVDQQAIAGSGTGGQVTGVINTGGIFSLNYATDTSGVIASFMGNVAHAKADIAGARFAPATDIFMTPARWEWLEQQVDTNGRPLITPVNNGPFNAFQISAETAVAQGATGGRMLGLNVWQDANIPSNLGTGANQDALIITKTDDIYLYETPVISRALSQTLGAQMTIVCQLYSYMAYTAARYPTGIAYVTGAILVPPTWNS